MKTSGILHPGRATALALLAALGLAGCGGSSSKGSASTGEARLTIVWPARTARLIPAASNSITVLFASGASTVQSKTVARPTSGSSTTVAFTGLPAGGLTLYARAYPTTDGSGTAQASARTTVTILAGSTISPTITMATTIASIVSSPASVSVSVNGSTTLTPTAYDSSSAVVLTSGFTYTSSDPSIATVSSAGLVTGVLAGSVTVTIKETESGVTVAVPVTVTSASNSIVDVANAYYATLTTAQKTATLVSATATNAAKWSNLPAVPASDGTTTLRSGVSYSTLTSTQQTPWTTLVQTALSDGGTNGYTQETQIRYSDNYLGSLTSGYSGDYQYVAFVGTPSTSAYWLLQVGGHHNAHNYTYHGTTLVSTTPYFLGVEPQSFTYAGNTYTPLGTSSSGQEGTMLALVKSLTTNQASSANLRASANGSQAFSDVYLGPGKDARSNFPTTNRGILGSSLTSAQQTLVMNAIQQWTKNSPLASTYNTLYQSELANTYVGYSNATSNSTPSTITFGTQGDYVRIDGPHVWIEFVCQTGVVIPSQIHYHTVWRDRLTDYNAEYFN